MIDWVIYITAGIVIGFAAGYFFSRLDTSMQKKCDELEQKLDTAHQEMTNYKQDVTQHFVKTSSLINNMTQSYRAVYDHMAEGANNLCSSSMIAHAKNQGELDIPTAKLIETESSGEATPENKTEIDNEAQSKVDQDVQPEAAVNLQQTSEQEESEAIHESPPIETYIDIENTDSTSDITPTTASLNATESTVNTESLIKTEDAVEAEKLLKTDLENELPDTTIPNSALQDDAKKDSTIVH